MGGDCVKKRPARVIDRTRNHADTAVFSPARQGKAGQEPQKYVYRRGDTRLTRQQPDTKPEQVSQSAPAEKAADPGMRNHPDAPPEQSQSAQYGSEAPPSGVRFREAENPGLRNLPPAGEQESQGMVEAEVVEDGPEDAESLSRTREFDVAGRLREMQALERRRKKREALSAKRRREDILIEWVAALLIALVLCIILTQVLFVNCRVNSESMENTFRVGDKLIGHRPAYLTEAPRRYDIIVFKFPDDESQHYVKRIIALPGEEVEIRDGLVYINGSKTPLEEDYVKGERSGDFGPYTVPGNMFFVLGDNREHSWDSRYWTNTCVDKMKIIGRVVYRLFPDAVKLPRE